MDLSKYDCCKLQLGGGIMAKVVFEREDADLKVIYLAYFAARLLSVSLASIEGPFGEEGENRFNQAWEICDALVRRFRLTLTEEQTRQIAQDAWRLFNSVMTKEFKIEWVDTDG